MVTLRGVTSSPPSDRPVATSRDTSSPDPDPGSPDLGLGSDEGAFRAVGPSTLGPNAWLVDEMHNQFLVDPSSVSASWQEFFADYPQPVAGGARHLAPAPVHNPPSAPAPPIAHSGPTPQGTDTVDRPVDRDAPGQAIRGVGARIVSNMEASLEVPTATSFRQVPAKLLEVNRAIINGYLGRTTGGKVSFTHLIGYALVRAIADHLPVMNRSFTRDDEGKPRVVHHDTIGLGIAVDLEKRDGSRSLVVPVIANADKADFATFVTAYEDLVRKVRTNKLSPDDMVGATVSLTNPGTIGTSQSVPRLMPGQGLIVGVGSLAYPPEYHGADPSTLAELGLSKIVTISSTYDHRIIQGAESGMFLAKVHGMLLGGEDFYEEIFAAVGVPYTAVEWQTDARSADSPDAVLEKQVQVSALVNMYRVRGHLIADLDPLAADPPETHPDLMPETYGLTIWDLDREFLTGGFAGMSAPVAGRSRMKLDTLVGVLRDAYARTVGIEYMHIQEPVEKRWIQEHVEGADTGITTDEQRHVLDRLNAAEALEKFLGTKYLGQKRFGIEGAESAIPLLDSVLGAAADDGMDRAIIGMAHRGRLNVLVNIVGKSYGQLFREFEGMVSATTTEGSGDVKYHLGQRGVFTSRQGRSLDVELAANPSHLEAVDPVVVGMARAEGDPFGADRADHILPVLLHGDAAFAGQGVVAETLNLSMIDGYEVGGTIHLIINNQLGFTTAPHSARSSEYPTDVAKMVQVPIFHVNGDDPEACVRVARLAFAYRKRFRKDVVIDMVGYRRHGHNEGDDPSYTQPLMYRKIDVRRSVRKIYTELLVRRGDISLDEAEHALDDFAIRLQTALDETRSDTPEPEIKARPASTRVRTLPSTDTSVPLSALQRIDRALAQLPDGFVVHPKLARQFATRAEMAAGGEVDWALGEAYALGSILADGTSIRLTGQDTRRGTFSHRHSTLFSHTTGAEYTPLSSLAGDGTRLAIHDSLLSEYAALGFEYGYSVASPETLVIWEAQFGDFINGAQIIIDQFIVAAEDKWQQRSGLVLLLPHGYEGQGPEHSSARIERFLILAAEDNIAVVNATTTAQFFHLLRRQSRLGNLRRPLVVFAPKSLLRSPFSRSPIQAFTAGGFSELLDDPGEFDESVGRIVFCSGKIAADAIAERDAKGHDAAVVRVEQLYPWPDAQVQAMIEKYAFADTIIWLQEEPENMGPWSFVRPRLAPFEHTHRVDHVCRPESGSPASGSHRVHLQEQRQLLDLAFGV